MKQADNQTGKGRKKALWAAVAVIAVAAAGVIGVRTVYEGKVSDFVARSGGKADSVAVDFLGRIHVRNLTMPLADGTNVRIAAVDGRQNIPFLKNELEMSGIEIEMPAGKMSMANARLEDASFDRNIPGGESAVPASKRIESFAAKRISTPEMTITQAITNTRLKTVYKNVVFADIASGRVARYSADSAGYDISMDIPDGDAATTEKRMAISTGAIAGQDFDAAYLARLYTEKAGPEDKDAKLLYGPVSISKIAFSEDDSHFGYDEIRSDGFSVRMPSEPLLETLKTLGDITTPENLSPAERQAFFAKAMSVINMVGKSDVQLLGLKVDAPEKNGENPEKRVRMTVDRMAMQLDSRKLDMGLHGMSIGSGEDNIAIAEASLTGFDWSSTLEGLGKIAGLDEKEITTFPFNQLLPELGTIRFAGINVDVKNIKSEDAAGQDDAATATPERVRFSLKNYEMALTKPYNGIPTDIRVRQDDLTLPVPADSQEEAFVQMRRLGLETLIFSYAIDAGWDEPKNNLVIREVSTSVKDIGSFNFSGLVSGFTKEFFSFDVNRAQAALFGLAGREVKLTISDEGMFAKGIKLYAAENNMTENQVRGTLTLLATAGLQQVASSHPKLQGATDALLRFIARPGTLTVTIRSTGPNGLGVFDLVAASQNPMLLLDKVDIEATAD